MSYSVAILLSYHDRPTWFPTSARSLPAARRAACQRFNCISDNTTRLLVAEDGRVKEERVGDGNWVDLSKGGR